MIGDNKDTLIFHEQQFTVHDPSSCNFVFNCRYTYKLGHRLVNGTTIWSQEYQFKSSPYPGQNSVQRVVIFGDMGKVMLFLFSQGGSNSNHVRNTENTFCRNIYTYMHKLHLTSQGYSHYIYSILLGLYIRVLF